VQNPVLDADAVAVALNGATIGRKISVFAETASTNDIAHNLALHGAEEGTVIFAEHQTRGRGRHGRSWASPRGKGLWFSIILRPKFPSENFSRITIAASVAVARAIETQTSLRAAIKWPNDVLLNGKKCAGILTESRNNNTAILGIGVDVNCDADDFPTELREVATSLAIESGKIVDRNAFSAEILRQLDELYRLAHENFERVADEWARRCTTLGKQIVVKIGERRIEGCAQALDERGALLVRLDSGRVEHVLGGDLVQEK
jgi:BirA family biotin operon repressor/biotin-[acetyl-CoA-carboxylase] ligase